MTEERNGIFECEFVYPITGKHYDEIQEDMIVGVIHDDSKTIQPFDIYKRTAPIDGTVTFYAHHISYRQSMIVVKPFTASSCTQALQKLKTEAVTTNPFTYVTDKTTAADFKLEKPAGIRQILGGVEGSILDVFGTGEYKFDKFTTYLYQSRGTDTDVQIRYGKNLTSIEKEYDISSIYNAAVPYWYNQEDGSIVMLPEKIIYASGQSGDVRAVAMDLSGEFEEAPTEAQLRQKATQKLNTSKAWLPIENITVDFVALWQTPEYASVAPLQRVRLCDTVSVYFPELGVVANRQKVIKTVYNVLLERYDSIELGEAKTSFADMITSKVTGETQQAINETVGFFQRAIDEATKLVTGGLGGYVVFNLNADGQPQEILVMDTDDITTAVNVIRINKNGIGFSQNGYNGPFSSAWTIDNTLNMSQINVINLTANLVRTGLLTDELGNNYWNLTTGEFRLASTTTVGGSTVQTIANNAASSAIDAQTQLSIFNKLTNNGQTQGIYLKNGKVYINADYMDIGGISADRINGGTLVISGSGTGIGKISVRDSVNVESGYWDDDEFVLKYTTAELYQLLTQPGSSVSTHWAIHHKWGRYTIGSTTYYGYLFESPASRNTGHFFLGFSDPSNALVAKLPFGLYERRDVRASSTSISQGTHQGVCIDYYTYFTGSSPTYHISWEYGDGLSIGVASGSSSGSGVLLLQVISSGIYYSRSGGSASSAGLYLNFSNSTYKIAGSTIQFASSSSKRYKKEITDALDDRNDPHRLYKLKTKQFIYKDGAVLQYADMAGQRLPGFIAEDVAEIYPAAVIHDQDGKIESWDERRILPGVLALVQEQKEEIDNLKGQIDKLKGQIETIMKQIAEMRTGA